MWPMLRAAVRARSYPDASPKATSPSTASSVVVVCLVVSTRIGVMRLLTLLCTAVAAGTLVPAGAGHGTGELLPLAAEVRHDVRRRVQTVLAPCPRRSPSLRRRGGTRERRRRARARVAGRPLRLAAVHGDARACRSAGARVRLPR